MKQSSESAELSVSPWDRTYECLNCWTEEKYHEFNTLNVLKTRLVLLDILCLHSSNRRGPETLCFCTVRPCVCVCVCTCTPVHSRPTYRRLPVLHYCPSSPLVQFPFPPLSFPIFHSLSPSTFVACSPDYYSLLRSVCRRHISIAYSISQCSDSGNGRLCIENILLPVIH